MRLLHAYSDAFDPGRPWIQESEQVRQDSRLFRQIVAHRRSPHSEVRHAFYRLQGPDWVNVVAFTPEGELLVVEQFRHGIDEATLEIPGGSCDEGETPEVSALRELREETGFEPGQFISLGFCTPNPATLTNRCHTFLALDCRPVGAQSLDRAEELRVWAFAWSEWEAALREGRVHHALVLTAFFKLQQWQGWTALRERL